MPEVEELECHKDDFLLASFMKSGEKRQASLGTFVPADF